MAPASVRRTVPALIVALSAVLALPTGATAAHKRASCAGAAAVPTSNSLSKVRSALLCLHNRERAAHGLPRLRSESRLRRAAARHARHMVRARFFSHVAPGGAGLMDRVRRTGYGSGRAWAVGENIAWGAGSAATAGSIFRSWMASPGHRANILRASFREIGLGISPGAPSGGRGATYTANFGFRR